jgi:hypothetical protein
LNLGSDWRFGDFDEQRNEEPDYLYTGEVVMEGELQEVPRSWRFKDEVVRFLTMFLPTLILEDFDRAESETVSSEIERQVEKSLQFFFCNPESIAKCQTTPGDIEMQVELWTWMKFMAPAGSKLESPQKQSQLSRFHLLKQVVSGISHVRSES